MTDLQSLHPLANKHIIISGAGIAGLAFTISLHKLWPSITHDLPPRITLYERDRCAVPENREGYSLSLRSDAPGTAIQTLQRMGLLDQLIDRSLVALCTGENIGKEEAGFCVWRTIDDFDKGRRKEAMRWEQVLKITSGAPDGCPVSGLRIARAELRRTLVEAVEQLPDVKIQWGSAITGVSSQVTNDKIEVTLSNGSKESGDLIIAADGSGSKMRSLLRPRDILNFAGPTCINARSPIKDLHPSNREDEFGTVISGHGVALFIAAVDDKNMVWSLSWQVDSPPLPRRQPLSLQESKEILDEARQKGVPLYGEKFEKILQATDLGTIVKFNAMDKAAFSHSPGYVQAANLEPLAGKVVFLGDANHAVSPFAGNGANLALMDGWDFAESLLQTENDGKSFEGYLVAATTNYDKIAIGRAKQVLGMSHFSILVMHSRGWWLSFWLFVLRIIRWLFFRRSN